MSWTTPGIIGSGVWSVVLILVLGDPGGSSWIGTRFSYPLEGGLEVVDMAEGLAEIITDEHAALSTFVVCVEPGRKKKRD